MTAFVAPEQSAKGAQFDHWKVPSLTDRAAPALSNDVPYVSRSSLPCSLYVVCVD